MERGNRLAVFEQIKEKATPLKVNGRNAKRMRSPEPFSADSTRDNALKKRRRRIILGKDEKLQLICECIECNHSSDSYRDYLKHLDSHADDIYNEDTDLRCLWDNCFFQCETLTTLKQHYAYHGYHLRLRTIGKNLLDTLHLPECKESDIFEVPKQPSYYLCEWDECNVPFVNYQTFIDHVRCHINGAPKSSKDDDDVVQCKWIGCSSGYPTQFKLFEHSRCHTKEKAVACPTCGVMFSCKTKFYDHRKRQLEVDLQGYQCSQCTKLFASERLLRDHMRIHINNYKCHLCEMTCAKPSTLAKHIRYRHLTERLFKCDICSHASVTQQDLNSHKETHSFEKRMECSLCDFKCRSKFSIQKHFKIVHENGWNSKYACHCCAETFPRGALLTKHLINVHDHHWPSGHSRFSYKQDPKTGLYHLQIVRYESVEVTQEMIEAKVNLVTSPEILDDLKYNCEQIEGNKFSFALQTDRIELLTTKPQLAEPNNSAKPNDVLIIKEMNNKGNLVQVETQNSRLIFCD